jgi:hypothetical protein
LNLSHSIFFYYTHETMSGSKPSFKIDYAEVLIRFVKYVMEGVVVAIAAYTLPTFAMPAADIAQIAAIAMATFAILDIFAPTMSKAARMGAGAGIGANLVGFPGNKIIR